MTPTQIKSIIDQCRLNNLRTTQVLEQYEAMVVNEPVATELGLDKGLGCLREQSKNSLAASRRKLDLLAEVLRRDEEANGWKGEDREVELV